MLYDDRDHPEGGLGFLLCLACGNEIIPRSGYPVYNPKTKFGWRKLGNTDMCRYLPREWKANIWRTKMFLDKLAAQPPPRKKKKRTTAATDLDLEKLEKLIAQVDYLNKEMMLLKLQVKELTNDASASAHVTYRL